MQDFLAALKSGLLLSFLKNLLQSTLHLWVSWCSLTQMPTRSSSYLAIWDQAATVRKLAPAVVFRLHNVVQWCLQENKTCKLSNFLNNKKLHRFSYCEYRMGWWDGVDRIQNYFNIKFWQRKNNDSVVAFLKKTRCLVDFKNNCLHLVLFRFGLYILSFKGGGISLFLQQE